MDRSASDRLVRAMNLPDMDSNSDLRRVTVEATMGQQATLDVDCAVDGITSRIKCDEETVPCVVDLVASVLEKAAWRAAGRPAALGPDEPPLQGRCEPLI
jgi:hypothetical protein